MQQSWKKKLNYALKEANNEKLAQKEEKHQYLNAQEQMGKKILKLATLKSFAHLNMQWLREKHDKALNSDKKNVTTETT